MTKEIPMSSLLFLESAVNTENYKILNLQNIEVEETIIM